MKTRQVLKLVDCGKRYTVEYHEGQAYPYRIYEHSSGYELDGRYHTHKKMVARYACLGDCLSCLAHLEVFA